MWQVCMYLYQCMIHAHKCTVLQTHNEHAVCRMDIYSHLQVFTASHTHTQHAHKHTHTHTTHTHTHTHNTHTHTTHTYTLIFMRMHFWKQIQINARQQMDRYKCNDEQTAKQEWNCYKYSQHHPSPATAEMHTTNLLVQILLPGERQNTYMLICTQIQCQSNQLMILWRRKETEENIFSWLISHSCN